MPWGDYVCIKENLYISMGFERVAIYIWIWNTILVNFYFLKHIWIRILQKQR